MIILPLVEAFKAQWCHLLKHEEILHVVRGLYLHVSCGAENKDRLSACMTLICEVYDIDL